jgi:hypothetical protein
MTSYQIKHTGLPPFNEDIYHKICSKISEDDETGCWNIICFDNYPRISIGKRKVRLNRLMLAWNGTEAIDKFACHTCNNSKCVNPDHLYWGSSEDNMRDKIMAGHGYKQVLSANDVKNIRDLKRRGAGNKPLAQVYNVSNSMINRIVNGKRWHWLAT